MHLLRGPLCIPPLLSPASLLTLLQFLSPTTTTTTTSPPLRALNNLSVKRPCSPFPDLFKSRDERYPHSPTPMGQGSGPSSNHRPLHSQPPPQEPGAGMAVGECLWSSAGLRTQWAKEKEQERGAVSAHIPQSMGKPHLRVYPHAHTDINTHSGPESTIIPLPPDSRAPPYPV